MLSVVRYACLGRPRRFCGRCGCCGQSPRQAGQAQSKRYLQEEVKCKCVIEALAWLHARAAIIDTFALFEEGMFDGHSNMQVGRPRRREKRPLHDSHACMQTFPSAFNHAVLHAIPRVHRLPLLQRGSGESGAVAVGHLLAGGDGAGGVRADNGEPGKKNRVFFRESVKFRVVRT